MIKRIDHIGIAVRNLEKRLPFWAGALGLEVEGIETVESEKVKVAMLPVGSTRIELLEATTDDSAVAAFIAKRGEGIHHVTFEVTSLSSALKELAGKGVPLVGDAPRSGAAGRSVAFLHPRGTGGVLIELVEENRTAPSVNSGLGPGSSVLAYLREPQEKLWGLLRRLDSSGLVIEGIDLGSFDDWLAQVEREEEGLLGPSIFFVPMIRVEKILLDRSSGDLPSLAERFERRLGSTVAAVFARLNRG